MKAAWQTLRSVSAPITLGILVVNTLVYLYQASLGPEGFLFTMSYAAIPERIGAALHWLKVEGPSYENLQPMLTLFTATFLHGNETHLGNNMLFLWIFGSLVERTLGPWRYLPVYLLCGAAGNLAQSYLHFGSPVPIIGASGAVAGLEATYLLLAMRWELPWPHVWPMARAVPPQQLAAVAVGGFILDMLSLGDTFSHVAYGAHIGGFLCGAGLGLLLTSLSRGPRPRPHDALHNR